MPIYEFFCLECSGESELLLRSSDWQDEAKCPHCGSGNLEKKLSTFSPSLVGGDTVDVPPCSGMPSNCGRCSLDH